MHPKPTEAGARSSAPDPHPEATPARVFAGGVLMGLANLVPGVSGGTMILALGLYDRFIESVAEIARVRPTLRSVTFIAVLAVGLAVAVLALSGPAVWLVTEHRWLAYSLFIGMTLGGVPLLWTVVRPLDGATGIGVVAGIAVMAAVAFGLQATTLPPTLPVFMAAGALAASSMILPGVSGSYILLILGLYDVVIGSLRPAALRADPLDSLGVIVPVGVGALVGVGLLSNVLQAFLERFERPSHALLLGLLLGSVLGLWPFQGAVHPDLVGEGRDVVEEIVAAPAPLDAEAAAALGLSVERASALRERYAGRTPADLKFMALQLERYRPDAARIGIALVALAAGFVLTLSLGGLRGARR